MADARYDGASAQELRERFGVPCVLLFDRVGSTLDIAHDAARSRVPAGTLILADQQTAGRGRSGSRWSSAAGAGIWLTIIERPVNREAVDVLAIRLGLRAAPVLDHWADSPIRLKWPNDLLDGRGKIGGILVESRWQDERLDWIAIGLGLNVRCPDDIAGASALRAGCSRVEILSALVPAIRAAAQAPGALTPDELAAWHARDAGRGRRCREPVAGDVVGIDRTGSLLVRVPDGVRACRSGSLVFEEES
ncbi:MAG: biotin--[acetyl-CoA-carboxylase] ligase [Gemmatimonadaceae bacterium]